MTATRWHHTPLATDAGLRAGGVAVDAPRRPAPAMTAVGNATPLSLHMCRLWRIVVNDVSPLFLANVGDVLIGPDMAQLASEHMVLTAHGSDTGRGHCPCAEWRRPARQPPGLLPGRVALLER